MKQLLILLLSLTSLLSYANTQLKPPVAFEKSDYTIRNSTDHLISIIPVTTNEKPICTYLSDKEDKPITGPLVVESGARAKMYIYYNNSMACLKKDKKLQTNIENNATGQIYELEFHRELTHSNTQELKWSKVYVKSLITSTMSNLQVVCFTKTNVKPNQDKGENCLYPKTAKVLPDSWINIRITITK